MPLARTFVNGKVTSTLLDAYRDRASKWSDIREYLPFLHDTAKSYENVRVLELGSRKGNSTLAFLAAAEEVDGHVWSGDITDVSRDPQGMLPWAQCPRWTFVCGDDMDPKIREWFPPQVDVFFLDTSHEYEHTLAELRAYMPRVAPGGVALFHDTNLYGWTGGLPAGIWAGGTPAGENYPEVRQALDEYCAETGLSWENLPGTYGLGVIRL